MSPVCLVQKKDEVWRKTVHYHKLNHVVILITTTLSNVLSFLEQINTSSGIQLRHCWSGKGFLLRTSAGRSLAANGNDVLSLWQSQIRELQCNCWGFWAKHALFDRQFLFWEMALGASLDPSTGWVTERSSSGVAWAACHKQEAAECSGPQWAPDGITPESSEVYSRDCGLWGSKTEKPCGQLAQLSRGPSSSLLVNSAWPTRAILGGVAPWPSADKHPQLGPHFEMILQGLLAQSKNGVLLHFHLSIQGQPGKVRWKGSIVAIRRSQQKGEIEVLIFSSIQPLSHVRLFVTPWTTTRQASLSIINSRSPPKPLSIESVMPSNHLILCRPLLLLLSIFPSIRVFSSESVLCSRWHPHISLPY